MAPAFWTGELRYVCNPEGQENAGNPELHVYSYWAKSRKLISRCSEFLLSSCSNGSILECSPLTVEARVRFPAGTCQYWDLWFRMVKSLLYKSSPEIIQRRPESRTIQLLSTSMFKNKLPHDFYRRTLIYSGQKRPQRVPAAHGSSQFILEFTVNILYTDKKEN